MPQPLASSPHQRWACGSSPSATHHHAHICELVPCHPKQRVGPLARLSLTNPVHSYSCQETSHDSKTHDVYRCFFAIVLYWILFPVTVQSPPQPAYLLAGSHPLLAWLSLAFALLLPGFSYGLPLSASCLAQGPAPPSWPSFPLRIITALKLAYLCLLKGRSHSVNWLMTRYSLLGRIGTQSLPLKKLVDIGTACTSHGQGGLGQPRSGNEDPTWHGPQAQGLDKSWDLAWSWGCQQRGPESRTRLESGDPFLFPAQGKGLLGVGRAVGGASSVQVEQVFFILVSSGTWPSNRSSNLAQPLDLSQPLDWLQISNTLLWTLLYKLLRFPLGECVVYCQLHIWSVSLKEKYFVFDIFSHDFLESCSHFFFFKGIY